MRTTRSMRGAVAALAAIAACAFAGSAPAASVKDHKAPQWFDDAKFGIMITWGAHSVPAYAFSTPFQPIGGYPYTLTGNYAEWYWNNSSIAGTPHWEHHLQTYGADKVYDDFIGEWKAERFDPDQWLSLFGQAGAKYFVLVTKHHDGVALWPSDTTGRDTGDLGPRRDIVGDLFEAARKRHPNLRPGAYYSTTEWYNPAPNPSLSLTAGDTARQKAIWGGQAKNAYTNEPVPYTGYKPIDDYAKGHAIPQIRELITRYGPEVLWCDIGGDKEYFQSDKLIGEFYEELKRRGKDGAVNDRCGAGAHHDFTTPEYAVYRDIHEESWEASRGLGFSYGHAKNEERDNLYVSADYLIGIFVDLVAKNGNLMLDIGPAADGTIPEQQASRLRDFGRWMKVNGEAIDGSRAWTQFKDDGDPPNNAVPVGVRATDAATAGEGDLESYAQTKPEGKRFTVKPDAFYVHALNWPGEELTIKADIPIREGDRVTMLGSDGELKWRRDAEGDVVVQMPAGGQKSVKSESVYVVKIAPRDGRRFVRDGKLTPDAKTPGKACGQARVRTTVTPRTLRVGRRTRLRVRVERVGCGRRAAVAGARVRVAGKGPRARTSRSGVARLSVRPRRAGRSCLRVAVQPRGRGRRVCVRVVRR